MMVGSRFLVIAGSLVVLMMYPSSLSPTELLPCGFLQALTELVAAPSLSVMEYYTYYVARHITGNSYSHLSQFLLKNLAGTASQDLIDLSWA